MEKLFAFMSILMLFPLLGKAQEKATIKIDIDRQIGEINKMVYGNFAEHLGRCVYLGIFEPGSPLSDENGFRMDVIKAVRELNVPVVRWPGGNFASGYHWMNGIGPKSQRPVVIDLAWGNRENNSFGTDEFMKWCDKVGTEPYLCVNLGTGTAEEASHWVEYCNIDKGTYYSDLRIKNGHKNPYKVIYWGLGNEVDGEWQIGHKNAEDYSKTALETAKLMRWVDKDIKLIASGSSNYGANWIHWNRTLLSTLYGYIDYISLHNYVSNNDDNYYKYMASTDFADNVISVTKNLIKEIQMKKKQGRSIYIAFDEYNASYNTKSHGNLKETFNLEDALCVASYLNAFIRHADIVKMANMAQIVNLLGPIATTKDGLWYQTIFYPLQLFANNCFGYSIDAFVKSPTYELDGVNIPYLDVSSAYNPNKKEIIVNVVNRNKDKLIATSIIDQNNIWGKFAKVYTVTGASVKAVNFPKKQNVKSVESNIRVKNGRIEYNFEPHSFTQIKISLN